MLDNDGELVPDTDLNPAQILFVLLQFALDETKNKFPLNTKIVIPWGEIQEVFDDFDYHPEIEELVDLVNEDFGDFFNISDNSDSVVIRFNNKSKSFYKLLSTNLIHKNHSGDE